jgi:hypothetical protein
VRAACAALDGIDPVTYLQPPYQSQDLVRGKIERMKGQSQVWMLHQREEASYSLADVALEFRESHWREMEARR